MMEEDEVRRILMELYPESTIGKFREVTDWSRFREVQIDSKWVEVTNELLLGSKVIE